MRNSSLMVVLMVGFLALTNFALAKPILDFQHESVYQSTFCQIHGCQFVNSSFDRSDGIDFEQYLYKLNNSLYFMAARFPSENKNINRYDQVSSVSIMARGTTKNLKKLEAFLPEFIGQTAFGHRIDFQYDFKQKCARVAETSYRGGGLFNVFAFGARGGKTLTISCVPRAFHMISITLYWGGIGDWIDHSFGFNCSVPDQSGLPACPWVGAFPRRIF
jgi:hypothetical protein